MTHSMIKIGIVGAGQNMIKNHIPRFQEMDGIKIAGVCNRSLESSQKVADSFDIPRIYENWMALVSDPDIDAVAIGTWPYLHCPITLAAINNNKHVLCEARMAMDASEACRMFAAARQSPHLVCQVVPSPFTLRVDKYIKKLIAEDYLGGIMSIEIEEGGSFLDCDEPLHWRQDTDLSGYNIMSLGIWYEALMRWVGGAKRVMAMGKAFTKMRRDSSGSLKAVQIPEHIDVIAEMICGALTHIRISKVTGLTGDSRAVLYGSKGTLCFSGNKLYGGKAGDSEMKEIVIPTEEEGRWRVEEEFVNAIRGHEAITHTTFADGVKYMKFTEAVYHSIESGKAVVVSG